MQVAASSLHSEACAQFAIGGYPPCDEDARGAEGFLSGKGFAEQVADDGVLKTCDEVEGLRVGGRESFFDGGLGGGIRTPEEGFATRFGFGAQVVELDVAKDRRLDSRKREKK